SEWDIHFLEELLVNDSISLLENESSNFDHQDDPSFPRPPPEPPDVEFFFDLEPNSGESYASFPIFEKSDNSYSDNSLPELEETRSGNTITHANNFLPEYDSFCFEIESDQGRLTSVFKKDIFDDLLNDPLLEEVDLFLASDNSIPPGIGNIDYDSEWDIHFLEELLVNDSISLLENESS
nr:hypothetical protein [Tanacetum cinerariifolium]